MYFILRLFYSNELFTRVSRYIELLNLLHLKGMNREFSRTPSGVILAIQEPSEQSEASIVLDKELIQRARNDLIFRTQGSAITVICMVIVCVAFLIRHDVNVVALPIWALATVATYLVRYLIYRRYQLAPEEDKQSESWQNAFTVSSAVSGIAWGLSVFVVFPESSLNHQMLLLLVMVFLSAATTVTHSAFRWAGISFTLFCLAPAVIKLLMLNQKGYSELGIFLFLFIVVMLASAKSLSEIANRMFMLSYENNVLISNLKDANAELVSKNDLLEETKKELSTANDSLQKLATTDALTNLTNRRKFEALVQVKWRRSMEKKTPISLLLANIDMFKQYNDFYGQRKGDTCMVQLSDLLQHTPELNRQGSCLARYSGDEFAVLLLDADAPYALRVAEKLRRDVEALRISRAEMPHELSPWVTVSVGVATESVFNDNSYEDLLQRTDRALHQAKRKGRNCVHQAD